MNTASWVARALAVAAGTAASSVLVGATSPYAGPEFQVNTTTAGQQTHPDVAVDADGDFIVSWTSWLQDGDLGVYARRYRADGTSNGTEFRVNTRTTSSQFYPALGTDADGSNLAAWVSRDQDDDDLGIFARRLRLDERTGAR